MDFQPEERKRTLTTLAGQIEEEINKGLNDLEDKTAKFHKEKQAFEHEKNTIASLNAKGSDVVKLNVGGRMFTTKRATLTSVEESLLAGMFSGRWDGSLDTDEDGSIFLDFEPDCFAEVLHRLRLAQLSGKKTNWNEASAPEGKSEYFVELLKFFTLVPQNGPSIGNFGAVWSGVSLVGDGSKVKSGGGGHASAFGSLVLDHGVRNWILKMHAMHNSNWIYAGVIASNEQPRESSYSLSSSNGWANSTQVYVQGACTHGHQGWQGFVQGDTVTMQMDIDARILRMKVDRLPGQVFTINVVDPGPWRVHVNLHGQYDEVQLISADSF